MRRDGPVGAVPLALLLAAPAAACPTAEDLAGGIRGAFADGTAEVHRAGDAPGIVVLEVFEDGAVTLRDVMLHGAYLARSAALSDGAERDPVAYDYAVPPPAPEAGLLFDVRVTERSKTSPPEVVEEAHAWGAPVAAEIGGCRYAAIDGVLTRRVDGAVDNVEVTRHLPELGIGYVRAAGRTLGDLRFEDYATLEAVGAEEAVE